MRKLNCKKDGFAAPTLRQKLAKLIPLGNSPFWVRCRTDALQIDAQG
jgi:hypothetical protein